MISTVTTNSVYLQTGVEDRLMGYWLIRSFLTALGRSLLPVLRSLTLRSSPAAAVSSEHFVLIHITERFCVVKTYSNVTVNKTVLSDTYRRNVGTFIVNMVYFIKLL